MPQEVEAEGDGHAGAQKRPQRAKNAIRLCVERYGSCRMPDSLCHGERSARPDDVLKRVGQGRRFKTIKKGLLHGRRPKRSSRTNFGVVWPQNQEQIMGYLVELAEAGSAPSVLWTFFSALVFFERENQLTAPRLSHQGWDRRNFAPNSLLRTGSREERLRSLPFAVVVTWEYTVCRHQTQELRANVRLVAVCSCMGLPEV